MPLDLSRFSYTRETSARLTGNPEDRREAARGYMGRAGEIQYRKPRGS